MQDWLVLQLADATFPSGGFAHSGGLEATMQAGGLAAPAALERFIHDRYDQIAVVDDVTVWQRRSK